MTAVFLISANGERQVAHESAVIDAATAAGTSLVVRLSTLGALPASPLPGLDWRIEERLRRSGVPAADPVRQAGTLVAPAGDGKSAMIDPWDVAEAAAAVLTSGGHLGRTYVLTGLQAITCYDVADELSTATGRSIMFVDVPGEAARQPTSGPAYPTGW